MRHTTIRRANDEDAADIATLLTQLGYPVDASEIPARLTRMHNTGAAAWVALDDGSIVGIVTAHILAVINRTGDLAQLTTLVVDERVRGQGIGRALVNAVEEFALQSGCERLSVTTHLDRAGAHAFYARMGFDYTGRRYGKNLQVIQPVDGGAPRSADHDTDA